MQDVKNADILHKVDQDTRPRDEILPILQSLNKAQMNAFYQVQDWCLC